MVDRMTLIRENCSKTSHLPVCLSKALYTSHGFYTMLILNLVIALKQRGHTLQYKFCSNFLDAESRVRD